jgi:hypothetical protein
MSRIRVELSHAAALARHLKETVLPCLRDSQSPLQYSQRLLAGYCTRKCSQHNWAYPTS